MLPREKEIQRSWLAQAVGWVLKAGEIPRHVAFIMDGNRRYARQAGKGTLAGHKHGFHKLTEVLVWCETLAIHEVTVYAFSAENFRRSQDEVDGLMNLAREKFLSLLKEVKELNDRGVMIRFIGEVELLPPDVRQPAAELEYKTRQNEKYTLNICIAYTSRLEVVNASKKLLQATSDKSSLTVDDIDESLVNRSLYLTSPPQLLIRTSGEVRLSDFLLFQTSKAQICFSDTLWPSFSIWDFYKCIIRYQQSDPGDAFEKPLTHRQTAFLKRLENSRRRQLDQYIKAT